MKRKISVILVLAMVFSMIMNLDLHAANIVHSGSFGQNIKWELTDDGVLTISGSGVMKDVISQEPGEGSSIYYYINGKWYGTPWYGYNKSESTNPITSIVIKKGITRIGDRCFYGLSNVESVSLPNDLKEIGEWAFYNLYKLKKIVIPDTVEKVEACAFDNCSELSAVTLPSSLTEISNSLFLGDKKLESIVIPEGVTIIGNSAFYNCKALKTVTIPASVTTINKDAFYGCNNIDEVIYNGSDEQWENIEIGANNEWLQLAYIPHNVTENGITYSECGNGKCCVWKISGLSGNIVIPAEVDFNLKTLKVCYITCGYYVTDKEQITGISFPDTIEVIQDFSFLGFTAIKKIELPSTTWRLDRAAFSGCTSLETFSAPGVTKLGPGAFINCTSLTNLTLSPDLTVAEGGAFQNCSSLELTVPQKLTEICERVFYGCTSMTAADIPAGVKSIGESAFEGCTGITTVTVPESLETIGAGAFKGCESFNELRLYDNLTEIGENAFFDCASLEKAIYFGTEEQWQNVAVQSGNENLLSALVIHPDHVYDDDFDLECNVCGHTRDKIMFNVVFKDYDGSVISNNFYKIGQSIQIPADPTRASDNTYTYTFSGWDKAVSSTCTGDAEYTAVFSKKYINYTVEFKDWDGSTISRKTYHYGDKITVPQVERQSDETFTYTFTGWDKPVPATCNGNAVYTAEYDQEYIDYTVTFKDYNGSIIRQNVYNYGDKIAIPANPSRASDNEFTYTFSGWDKQVPSNCTGNMEFTAQYNRQYIEYRITFYDYDGSVLSDKTYHYGNSVKVPSPQRESDDVKTYTFTGWDKTVATTCTGNAAYTAQYREDYIDYTVTFKNYDNSIISQNIYNYGDRISVPSNPSRADENGYSYTFTGWDKQVPSNCTGNMEFTAQYESKQIDYTVKFKDYDGTVISEKTYHYGDKITVPNDPVREEDDEYIYTFTGWGAEITVCKGNAEYTAEYSAKKQAVLGDINSDEVIDNKDVVSLFRYVSGTATGAKESICDVNYDKTIDNKDVVTLFKYTSENWPHFHLYGDWTIIKEATCTESGKRVRECIYGETDTQTIAAKGHTFGESTILKEATCTEDGELTHTCKICGVTVKEKIAAKGHSFDDWKTVKEATCTEDGSQKHVCSDCGKAETQKISAKGHSYGSWKTTKNATCTQSGEQQHTCSVCGKTETQKIPAKGHVSGTAVRENEIPAPCGGTGSYDLVTRCSVCSAELSRQTIRYSSSYSKHTDTPTCQHCGANVRGELIAALKKDLLYDTDNYIVLASTTNFIIALSLANSGDPALFVLNDDVSTMLILEDTDTIAFLTATSTNKLIAGDSVKKSNFSSSYQYMPYDDTNISTTTYDGIDLINTLQQIAALDITECIKLLNSYLKNHGYSYTVKALGFSKFTS